VERHWLAPDSQFHRFRLRPDGNVLSTSVAIDRPLVGGDTFFWERYAIQVVATPGHTDGSLFYVVDCAGTRVAFVGDLLYGEGQFWELWSLQGPPPDDPVGLHDYHAFCGRGRQAVASLERLLTAMLLWEHPNCGLDPQWLRLHPYRQTLAPGSGGQVMLQVNNGASSPLDIRTTLHVPEGWQTESSAGEVVAPRGDGAWMMEFSLPPNTAAGRYVLTAQLWVNGRNLGDWTEGLVDVPPRRSVATPAGEAGGVGGQEDAGERPTGCGSTCRSTRPTRRGS